jgi:UDP-N-acetylglucosamine 2-epimerase (non-hydrolysing)
MSIHREENVDIDTKFYSIINCINNIVETYNKRIIISVHPRTRKRIEELSIKFSPLVTLSEPFGIIDYCRLQTDAITVISDSGTVTEESIILKFPAVLLRNSTEHPEGLDSGGIVIGDICWPNLKTSLELVKNKNKWNQVDNYTDDNVSEKICGLIASYTGLINKFVWMK